MFVRALHHPRLDSSGVGLLWKRRLVAGGNQVALGLLDQLDNVRERELAPPYREDQSSLGLGNRKGQAPVQDRETLAEFPSMRAGGVRTNHDLRDDAADRSDA